MVSPSSPIIRPSLLSTIINGLKLVSHTNSENVHNIALGRPGNGYDTRWFQLSSSLGGVVACIVTEHKLEDCVLKIDRTEVARERLPIFLWVVEHAPNTLREAVRISLKYEQENADV